MYAKKTNESLQKKYNLWFVATLFLCVVVLVLSAFVYYVFLPIRNEKSLNTFFDDTADAKASHMICIEESMTLAEIAERTDLTFSQLYEVMNIPSDTDPNTTLAELFESYKEEAEELESE